MSKTDFIEGRLLDTTESESEDFVYVDVSGLNNSVRCKSSNVDAQRGQKVMVKTITSLKGELYFANAKAKADNKPSKVGYDPKTGEDLDSTMPDNTAIVRALWVKPVVLMSDEQSGTLELLQILGRLGMSADDYAKLR